MQLSSARRTLLNEIGILILVVGFCVGGLIYRSAPPDAGGSSANVAVDDSSLPPEDTRRYAHDTEMNFGKLGLLMDEGKRAAAKLGEPKPLAFSVAVVSIIAAAGCFVAGAHRGRLREQ
jgi:hypothetical protein